MEKVDGLSRRPDWEIGVKKDNEKQRLVKKEQLKIKRIQIAEVVIERVNLLDKVRKCKTRDNKVVKTVEEMKQVVLCYQQICCETVIWDKPYNLVFLIRVCSRALLQSPRCVLVPKKECFNRQLTDYH